MFKNKRGFTITEAAILLVVIGILFSLASKLYKSLFDTADIVALNGNIHTAEQVVTDFAMLNGRLPNETEFKGLFSIENITYTPNDNYTDAIYEFNRAKSICGASTAAVDVATAYTLFAEKVGVEQSITKTVKLPDIQHDMGCNISETVFKIEDIILPVYSNIATYNGRIITTSTLGPFYACAELPTGVDINLMSQLTNATDFFKTTCKVSDAKSDWLKSDVPTITFSIDPDDSNTFNTQSLKLNIVVVTEHGLIARDTAVLNVQR